MSALPLAPKSMVGASSKGPPWPMISPEASIAGASKSHCGSDSLSVGSCGLMSNEVTNS